MAIRWQLQLKKNYQTIEEEKMEKTEAKCHSYSVCDSINFCHPLWGLSMLGCLCAHRSSAGFVLIHYLSSLCLVGDKTIKRLCIAHSFPPVRPSHLHHKQPHAAHLSQYLILYHTRIIHLYIFLLTTGFHVHNKQIYSYIYIIFWRVLPG